jgi:hypothetical protein
LAAENRAESIGMSQVRDAGSRASPDAHADLDAIFKNLDRVRFQAISRDPMLIDVKAAKIR